MAQTEEADWPATKSSIGSDNPYRPKLLAQMGPPSLVLPQFDKLLKMAEDLQEKCDVFVVRRTRFLMINIAGILIVILACVFAVTNTSLETKSFAFFAGVLMISSFACINMVLTKNMMYAMNRQEKRDRKALFSIVDMLREIEPIIAEKEELSTLEHAEIRIRLARLDIGPGGSR
jgi:uncharacterized integral membrane protein